MLVLAESVQNQRDFEIGQHCRYQMVVRGCTEGHYSPQQDTGGILTHRKGANRPNWHTFLAWALMKQNLPVNSRLAIHSDINAECQQCHLVDGTHNHLFFQCTKAKAIKSSRPDWVNNLLQMKANKARKKIIYASIVAGLYHLWWAHNQLIFQKKDKSSEYIYKSVKEQITQ
ncbi:hypothetical protein Cgig2_001139 [Carnegiea gigantea]|uniref:Reverse transcriptase zinc-binding domain-containing protein n=1 Tax=Carnegiea gigantea TaxID=171969 RepID=A0A9Q1JLB5_9CARY|nr:hypothetical protein Cgig2_001139 [Carnegiea gigantea]